MEYLAASGFFVAALIGSVIYENRRLKKKEAKTKERLRGIGQD